MAWASCDGTGMPVTAAMYAVVILADGTTSFQYPGGFFFAGGPFSGLFFLSVKEESNDVRLCAHLTMLGSAEWNAEREREDPTMMRHIPQLIRINAIGLLTFDSQAGRVEGTYKERAYCFGFVRDRECALQLTEWVSLNTDKYASLVVVQGDGRPDPHNRFVASAEDVMLRTTAGRLPVSIYGAEIHSHVSPFTIPANRYVAGDAVPSDAECVLFVDLVWGRPADSTDGLLTAIESGLARLHAAGEKITSALATKTTSGIREPQSLLF